MGIESVLGGMEAAVKVAESQKASIDPNWTPEAKKAKTAEIDGWLAGRLAELRTEADQGLQAERAEAAQKDYRRRLAAGPQGNDWTQAQARAGFVAADVAEMRPEEIPAAYLRAKAAGDSVGAWLIERAGRARLAELRKAAEEGKIPPAPIVQAEKALKQAAWATLDTKAAEERKQIDDLQARLLKALSRGHRPDVKINF